MDWSWIVLPAVSVLLGMAVVIIAVVYVRGRVKMQKLEDQLRLARKAVEEKERASRHEMAILHNKIAQAFRIPISVILGYAELIRDGFAGDKDYIHKLCDKTAYMNEVLSHILLEFQTRNQTNSPLLARMNLLETLHKAAAGIAGAALKRGIAVNVVSGAEEIWINGEETGLAKAFGNILENSLKYMGRPGNIQITASKLEKEVILVFKDDGEGMDGGEAEHIFKLNYQGSNRKAGEGLGMYAVKTEVEAHGGTASVKTEPGGGLGVFITLPLAGGN
ncbi:MAG: HAMP domain-containing histidine kinase [Oscillospiraceae bacterium]|nr:HAMP domain-containing histidine kinase [Oscillospiraceae bacterium]